LDETSVEYQDGEQTRVTPVVDRDFDALGRLEKLTDQEGAETVFTYDNRGNVETVTDPQGKVTTMTYDELGRLETTTDRNGDVSIVNYTESGQIDNVDYPGESEDVDFTYDLRDQVDTMTDSLGTTDYDYDAIGRLEKVTDANGFVIEYGYDKVGNLKTLTYPGGKVVTYGYDAVNRLKIVTTWLNETITYFYDAAGRLDYRENANSTITDYTYDNANRLTRLTDKKSNGEVISEQVFTLDPNGNPETEFRIQPQAPQEIESELSYQYNVQRTRLESVIDADDNQILNTYNYDDEGQQVSKNQDTRVFDARNRLTKIDGRLYGYDGNNQRLSIEQNGETRFHIYDSQNNLLAEANQAKEIIRYYIHGDGLNQLIQGNQSYTYHHSSLGHTLAITDQVQEVQNQYAYDPFGRILGQTEASGLEQSFKYVGKYGIQHESGSIYYMRARYYDAELGRFLKEDPIGFEGGLNVSLYVESNPIARVDPSGLLTVQVGIQIRLPTFPGSPTIEGSDNVKPRGISGAFGFSVPFFDGGDFDIGFTGSATVGGSLGVGTGRVTGFLSASQGSLRDQRGESINVGFNDGIGGLTVGLDEGGQGSVSIQLGPGFEAFVDTSLTGVLSFRDGADYVADRFSGSPCGN